MAFSIRGGCINIEATEIKKVMMSCARREIGWEMFF